MTQSIPLGSDARERFLLEIAAVVPPTRVSAVHFFAPLRQGPIETGVAVIAATPEGAESLPIAPVAAVEDRSAAVTDSPEESVEDSSEESVAMTTAIADHRESETPEGSPVAVIENSSVDGSAVADSEYADPAAAKFPEGAKISARHVVYSARYRWTRKGPERGKWESEVVAEADAPLLTVESVVQGVQRRASEPLEVAKFDGDTIREMIAKAQQRWPTTP